MNLLVQWFKQYHISYYFDEMSLHAAWKNHKEKTRFIMKGGKGTHNATIFYMPSKWVHILENKREERKGDGCQRKGWGGFGCHGVWFFWLYGFLHKFFFPSSSLDTLLLLLCTNGGQLCKWS